ncbi:unnamed protein product [Symbiodinium microadriaticum]|nr:unnamed protein product [Symbiodinium sp. KB8]CAE7887094.1 unnamed protein product [Symbiodinium microadriaticum]
MDASTQFASPNVAIRHFLDILHDVPKEDIDTDMLKGIFKDKAWGDLPYALKIKGHPNFDYKSQFFILTQYNGKLTIVKHFFLTKAKLTQAKLKSFAVGTCYEIVWGSGNKVLERKAFQWMLEQMGGLQFRQFSLTGERKRSASSAALRSCSEADQDAGWDYIIEHGERDRGQLKQLRWIHKHINQDGSPIRGWPEKLVQKALDSLANDGCLAKLTTRYDLTIQDFHPTFLENIYKDFDFFRGIFFGKATPALYDDGDISGQLRIVIDNTYAADGVIAPDVSMLSHDDFIKMIRPAIGYISDADSRAILKRSVFMVFTKDSIYYRPPSERPMDVRRHKWALRDILVDECKTRFSNFKKNGPVPQKMAVMVAAERAWLDEALNQHDSANSVAEHFTNTLSEPRIKTEPAEFSEAHEGLANMCAGEVLDAESPEQSAAPAPVTPTRKIKQGRFDQAEATFLLRSSAFSKALGPSDFIELSPSSSMPAASPGKPSSAPPMEPNLDFEVRPMEPNPDFEVPGSPGSPMDVADSITDEENIFGHGGSLNCEKRPATKKTTAWQAVKYIRENRGVGPRGVRKEQVKWKRNLLQLLLASNKNIVKMLVADGVLPNWKNKVCPRCETGRLSELGLHNPSGQHKHRCSSRTCHVWISPQHLHPLFTDGRGTGAHSLQMQSSLLLMKLLRVPHPSIHLLDINHKAIEDMEKRLCELRRVFVEKEEKKIVFGDGKNWKDVEADEATFDKRDISNDLDFKHLVKNKNTSIMWEQWAGCIQRGAIRRIEWKQIGTKLLKVTYVIGEFLDRAGIDEDDDVLIGPAPSAPVFQEIVEDRLPNGQPVLRVGEVLFKLTRTREAALTEEDMFALSR